MSSLKSIHRLIPQITLPIKKSKILNPQKPKFKDPSSSTFKSTYDKFIFISSGRLSPILSKQCLIRGNIPLETLRKIGEKFTNEKHCNLFKKHPYLQVKSVNNISLKFNEEELFPNTRHNVFASLFKNGERLRDRANIDLVYPLEIQNKCGVPIKSFCREQLFDIPDQKMFERLLVLCPNYQAFTGAISIPNAGAHIDADWLKSVRKEFKNRRMPIVHIGCGTSWEEQPGRFDLGQYRRDILNVKEDEDPRFDIATEYAIAHCFFHHTAIKKCVDEYDALAYQQNFQSWSKGGMDKLHRVMGNTPIHIDPSEINRHNSTDTIDPLSEEFHLYHNDKN